MLSPIFTTYMLDCPNPECPFLWFIARYIEIEEQAIVIVMEQLPIIPVIIEYLKSDEYPMFKAALKVAGNIVTSSNSSYTENLYKNGVIENIVMGWRRFEAQGADLNKEIAWILCNLTA